MKDTSNLLTTNEWSAGEYENIMPLQIFNTIAILTKTYSSIGEQSVRLTKNASSGSYSRITYNQSILNKTITASAHIRTCESTAQLLLLEIDTNRDMLQNRSITIPSNSHGNFSISLDSGSADNKFIIQFSNLGVIGDNIFVDDICLTVI